MGALDWYDTNHDGTIDFAELDRWQLDNGGYPGQFENDTPTHEENSCKKESFSKKLSTSRSGEDKTSTSDDWDSDHGNDFDDSEDDYDDVGDFGDYHDLSLSDAQVNDGATPFKRIVADVAGIGFDDRAAIWDEATDEENNSIELIRELHNAYDDNAIAVYVNDEHAGYIPKIKAETIAPLIDAGFSAVVSDCSIRRIKREFHDDSFCVELDIRIYEPTHSI